MKNDELISHYVGVAKLLAEMFAPNMETLVHDLTQKGFPIIAIYNGHVTNRKIADESSVFDSGVLREDFPDYLVNYFNKSPQGHRLKSSTKCIRNEKGELIAALGINYDVSCFEQIETLIKQFMSFTPVEYTNKEDRSHFLVAKDEIKSTIKNVMLQNNFLGHKLSKVDKKKIVKDLYMSGNFNKHGIVSALSEELKVTRATIYKYVREIRENYD